MLLYIFNDNETYEPKKIDFEAAVSDIGAIKIENMAGKSKTYYDKEKLKDNILELHKKEFLEALFASKVYVLEGVNDELFLKKMLKETGHLYEQYSILPCYGKPHYLPFLKIFRQLGIITYSLFDEDESDDTNNIEINKTLASFGHYVCFSKCLERYLGFKDKSNSVKFIGFLDGYDNYDFVYSKLNEDRRIYDVL